METKHIKISDYNYSLPEERIAKFPLLKRDNSKLLVYKHGQIMEDHFFNLSKYLPQGSLMVFNNTKVIQARLHFKKETGATIEIFLMEPAVPKDYELIFQSTGKCSWYCMVGNLKKWKDGSLFRDFSIKGEKLSLKATLVRSDNSFHIMNGTNYLVNFEWNNPSISFAEILESVGELPIPP